MKLYTLLLIVLTGSLTLISCQSDDETCRESTRVTLKVGFYTAGTTKAAPVDSITVRSLANDSIYYNNKKNVSNLELALDHSTELLQYAIRFNTQWDTITLIYSSEPYFVSYACGMVFVHELDTALTTNHVIKNLQIPEHLISTANAQHIQIYR